MKALISILFALLFVGCASIQTTYENVKWYGVMEASDKQFQIHHEFINVELGYDRDSGDFVWRFENDIKIHKIVDINSQPTRTSNESQLLNILEK